MPIPLTGQAKIEISDANIRVSGPKGTLEQTLVSQVTIKEEDGVVRVERIDDSKKSRAMHGLYRMLVSNMVEGSQVDSPENLKSPVSVSGLN